MTPGLTRSACRAPELLCELVAPRRRHASEAFRDGLGPERRVAGRWVARAFPVPDSDPTPLLAAQVRHGWRVAVSTPDVGVSPHFRDERIVHALERSIVDRHVSHEARPLICHRGNSAASARARRGDGRSARLGSGGGPRSRVPPHAGIADRARGYRWRAIERDASRTRRDIVGRVVSRHHSRIDGRARRHPATEECIPRHASSHQRSQRHEQRPCAPTRCKRASNATAMW